MTIEGWGTTQLGSAFPNPKWSWLRIIVRTELERRRDASTVTIPLAAIDPSGRPALVWLLDLTEPLTDPLRVSIKRLDKALATKTDARLTTVALLTALDGDLVYVKDQQAQLATATAKLWKTAHQHPATTKHPTLHEWLEIEQTRGTLPANLDQRNVLLISALDVLVNLPANSVTLTRLAASSLGSAHALDKGALSGLVLRAIAHMTSRPNPIMHLDQRHYWRAVGVQPERLSSRVLTLGLRPHGNGPLAVSLNALSDAGEPSVLTLRQLINAGNPDAFNLTGLGNVFVCENVAVIAEAADELGPKCPPMICGEGWPSSAALLLMTNLIKTENNLRYHGDFDWDGIAIAEQMVRLGLTPWRMTADDYRRGTIDRRLPVLGRPLRALSTYPGWCSSLVTEMASTDRRLEEEHLIDELIGDLREASERCTPHSGAAGYPAQWANGDRDPSDLPEASDEQPNVSTITLRYLEEGRSRLDVGHCPMPAERLRDVEAAGP